MSCPGLIAAAQACVSFHWMLIDQRGLVDGLLSALFGIDGPIWFNNRWLALGVGHRRLYLEMDAVLDRDLPRRPDDDPAGHL